MNIRRHMRASMAAAAATMLLVVVTGAEPGAQGRPSSTTMTFSAPVRVPGATLSAGTYSFERTRSDSDRLTVQIYRTHPRHLIATLMATPVTRDGGGGDITIAESPGASVPLLRVWYERGTQDGYAFIYGRQELDSFLHPPVVLSTR